MHACVINSVFTLPAFLVHLLHPDCAATEKAEKVEALWRRIMTRDQNRDSGLDICKPLLQCNNCREETGFFL